MRKAARSPLAVGVATVFAMILILRLIELTGRRCLASPKNDFS
jgi:hypothetical protein